VNTTETKAILAIMATAHDKAIPDGLAEIWHAGLGDLDFGLARDAAMELIRTSPYLPKVAEIRERARLIRAERQRADRRRAQVEQRDADTPHPTRTGAAMIAHVLGRLKDAGQDVAAGKPLGRQRAADIAEMAAEEWLRRTQARTSSVAADGPVYACPACFAPLAVGAACSCQYEAAR
jgi:hypothetical protein